MLDLIEPACRAKNEKLDCTVEALSHFRNIPYDEAHEILTMLGRKPKHMCYDYIWKKSIDLTGKYIKLRKIPKTVRALHLDPVYQKGSYYVVTREHVFAVVNGCSTQDRDRLIRIKQVYKHVEY